MLGVQDVCFWLANVLVGGATAYCALYQGKADASGVVVLCQCFVAFPVFSVMTIRASEETPFRPGDTKTLEEEFTAYGYSSRFCLAIRIIKSFFAVSLIVG